VTFNLTDKTTDQKCCLSEMQRMEWRRNTNVTSDLTEKKKQPMRKAVLSIIKRFYCKQNASY
jgi:hypothetical protein